MIRRNIIGALAGILLLSSCDSDVYYTLPVGNRLLSLCQEVVVEKNGEICIPSDRVTVKITMIGFISFVSLALYMNSWEQLKNLILAYGILVLPILPILLATSSD